MKILFLMSTSIFTGVFSAPMGPMTYCRFLQEREREREREGEGDRERDRGREGEGEKRGRRWNTFRNQCIIQHCAHDKLLV